MARPFRVTASASGSPGYWVPDLDRDPFNIGIGVTVNGTLTYNIEYTFDDTSSPTFNPATATWTPLSTLTGKTATADSNIAYPVTGIRINVTSYTSGSAVATFIQAGRPQGV